MHPDLKAAIVAEVTGDPTGRGYAGKSAAEAVALAAGPAAKWAWQRSYEWRRDSELMQALAAGLQMTPDEIDAAFIAADAIEG